MYGWYYGLHLLSVVSWMVFLLQFIKSIEYKKFIDEYIFGFLSIFFMVILTYLGTKLILLNPSIEKSGGWLHLKLSIVLIIMIENIYLMYAFFRKKELNVKLLEIIYWVDYILFIIILYLTMFRPF